jgi:hypothetical protein
MKVAYDVNQEPTVLSKPLLDLLFNHERGDELIALYVFYYYTAKWQQTNQPKATTNYVAKRLRWSEERVRLVKNILKELGLIEDVQNKNAQGKIIGHYVKVNFIWKTETVATLTTKPSTPNSDHGLENPDHGLPLTVGALAPNALSTVSENALSSGSLFSYEKREACAPLPSSETKEETSKGFKRINPVGKNKTEPLVKEAQPLVQEKKQRPELKTSEAFRLIKHWEELNLAPVEEKYKTATANSLAKLIEGKMFKGEIGLEKYWSQTFGYNDIKQAMERFKLAAFDENYFPNNHFEKLNLQKLPLNVWILKNHGKGEKRSSFIKYFKRAPKLSVFAPEEIPDDHPELTQALKKEYDLQVMKGKRGNFEWSGDDENKFRKASNRLHDFVKESNGNMPDYLKTMMLDPNQAARVLTKSIINSLGEYDDIGIITPGWFPTLKTIPDRLQKYINERYPTVQNRSNFSAFRE